MRDRELVGALLLNLRGDLIDMVIEGSTLSHKLTDLPISMHHSGVVTATEGLANLRKREVGEFAAEIHRNLASLYKCARA